MLGLRVPQTVSPLVQTCGPTFAHPAGKQLRLSVDSRNSVVPEAPRADLTIACYPQILIWWVNLVTVSSLLHLKWER